MKFVFSVCAVLCLSAVASAGPILDWIEARRPGVLIPKRGGYLPVQPAQPNPSNGCPCVPCPCNPCPGGSCPIPGGAVALPTGPAVNVSPCPAGVCLPKK